MALNISIHLLLVMGLLVSSCGANIQSTELSSVAQDQPTSVAEVESSKEAVVAKFKPEKISYAFVEKDELFGMVNSMGEEVIPPVWHSIRYLNDEMIAVEYDSGNIEVQNMAGEKLHVFGDWESVGPYVNGVAWIFTGDSKLFLIDRQFERTKELTALGFGTSMVWGFNAEGLAPHCAVACKGCASGPCGLVNTKGELVVDYLYQGRELSDKGNWIVWDKNSDSGNGEEDKGVVNSQGELIVPIKYRNISQCGENTFTVWSQNGDELEEKWIGLDGAIAFDKNDFDFVTCVPNKNLVMVRKDSKYGFLDPDGTIAIPLIYDGLFSYQAENNLIGVEKHGEKFFIDISGRQIDFQFEDYMSFPRIGKFEDAWSLGASKEFYSGDHEMFVVNEDYTTQLIGSFSYFEGLSGGVGIVRSQAGEYSIVYKNATVVELADYDDVEAFFYP